MVEDRGVRRAASWPGILPVETRGSKIPCCLAVTRICTPAGLCPCSLSENRGGPDGAATPGCIRYIIHYPRAINTKFEKIGRTGVWKLAVIAAGYYAVTLFVFFGAWLRPATHKRSGRVVKKNPVRPNLIPIEYRNMYVGGRLYPQNNKSMQALKEEMVSRQAWLNKEALWSVSKGTGGS